MARRWTKEEKQALLQGVGVYGIAWFKKHGGNAYDWPNALEGRSAAACYSQARRLFGSGGLSRGSYSVNEIIKKTGYSKTHIRRAMKALAQKWKRLSPKGSYLIYEEQYMDIIGWLMTDYWAPIHRLYNCIWCHQTSYPHKGKGLCLRCYRRYIRRLRRMGMPSKSELLLTYCLQCEHQCFDAESLNIEQIRNQLSKGRALPESFFVKKREDTKCFIDL